MPNFTRAPKYRNTKTIINGIVFDSKKEAARYSELTLMERAGKITELKRQVKYVLIPKQEGERECYYVADFQYREGGEVVVEDVKSSFTMKLPTWVIKRKLMLHVHGVRVRMV